MGKVIGAAEFKAKCLAILDEVQATGEPVTITKRGKPVAIIEATDKTGASRPNPIGFLAHPGYRFDADPGEPACDPGDWEALR